jgi:alkanesulfonate monooxygenase SsuD/methylene tetrahydromethanopterin reductase-like flavin-dependent oxidoreductase (luciferase family)
MPLPPVEFGIGVTTAVGAGMDPMQQAHQAEQLGFDLVTVSDHLHGDRPTYETWTLLTWLAAQTHRVKVAPLVLGLPYRHPTVTAKMAEGLQRLSGGRLVLGMGGGGFDPEFVAYGLDQRTPGQKVAALTEALEVMHGVWTGEPFTFEGDHFRTRDARVSPPPSVRIPIWLGSNGPKALALTGRVADGWNPSLAFNPPEVAKEKRDVLRKAAEDAGRDPDTIVCAYNVGVRIDPNAGIRPGVVSGTTHQIAEILAGFVRDGFTTLCFWARDDEDEREHLAREVLPAVRELAS